MEHQNAKIINKAMVDRINSLNTTWKADLYENHYVGQYTRSNIKRLLGARLEGGPKLKRKTFAQRVQVPDSFDSRTNWVPYFHK